MAKNGNQGKDSGGSKALLLILGVGGVCLLLCCGGVYWGYQKLAGKFGEAITMDPEKVRTQTAAISAIEIPADYEPKMGMDMTGFGLPMKMVMYGRTGTDEPTLVLMQAPDNAGAGGMNRAQFEDAMAQQGHGQNIQVDSREVRIFDYAGEEYALEFVSGAGGRTGGAARQASGVFPTQGGPAFLTVIDSEENWDDEAVMQMIESTGGKYLRTEEAEPASEPESAEPESAEPEPAAASATEPVPETSPSETN